MRVKHLIDKIISHNEIIAIWETRSDAENGVYHYQLWRGMAWDLSNKRPDLYKSKFVKIFGTIPESIIEADTINIEISNEKEN